jgi:CRISPR-associated protein Csm1
MKEHQIKIALASLVSNISRLAARASAGADPCGLDFLTRCSVPDNLKAYSGAPDPAGDPEKCPDSYILTLVKTAGNIAAASIGLQSYDAPAAKEDPDCQFESIYNLLNLDERGNSPETQEKYFYGAAKLDEGIRFPLSGHELKCGTASGSGAVSHGSSQKLNEEFYRKIMTDIEKSLKKLEYSDSYLSSLLEILEVNTTYVPAFCSAVSADISMFDHMKMSVALALALDEYIKDQQIAEPENFLNDCGGRFLQTDSLVMFSMDLCGIQDFIYTITTDKALKTLRSRSFYLELLMEHMIDMLLDEFSLCRMNLIYSGGGHCYILLPNLRDTKEKLSCFCRSINRWLIDAFDISLFLSSGAGICSPAALCNSPNGSLGQVFIAIGEEINRAKNCRYSAAELKRLNSLEHDDYTRECSVCRRTGHLNKEGKCASCLQLEEFSNRIQNGGCYFTVLKGSGSDALPLPGDCCLVADTPDDLKIRLNSENNKPVRVYSKNSFVSETGVATRLWVGDYYYDRVMEKLAAESTGIKRIAVLRADVDNLGQTFVKGFESKKYGAKYVNLARTAALSRSLSLFFKHHINTILERSEFTLSGKKAEQNRKVTIVYSGGDDIFLIGAWNEVIECAVDISRNLKKYTCGALTISAGIGFYSDSYPVSAAAEETAVYEDASKGRPGKSALTLFSNGTFHDENGVTVDDGTFSWSEFEAEVAGSKFKVLSDFFGTSDSRGNSFLYRIMELICSRREKISFARLAYLLSRLEPPSGAPAEEKQAYSSFSRNIYEWMSSEKDCRELRTAIQLYVYMNREKSGGENEQQLRR